MKSSNETYASSHGNTHETFADLVFSALVVLVLFVVTLAVEVSQRVRASLISTEVVPVVEVVEQIETLTPEGVKELSERLQKQQSEMEAQRRRMADQEQQLSAKDFKDVLLAIGGRGVMLDFTGYTGKAPDWLVQSLGKIGLFRATCCPAMTGIDSATTTR